MFHVKETDGGVSFAVKVIPRSSRCEISGIRGDALVIKLTDPPLEGRANSACIECIAGFLDLPKSNVRIIAGFKAKNKRLLVTGITREQVVSRIGGL